MFVFDGRPYRQLAAISVPKLSDFLSSTFQRNFDISPAQSRPRAPVKSGQENKIMTPLPDYSPDPTLTPQQHRVLSLLAAGSTITQAAAALNIHRNTIGYWRRTVPAFSQELEFATQEQRQYWHEQAAGMAPFAIQSIQDSLTSPDSSPSLRFRAAVVVLKMATDPESKSPKPFPTVGSTTENAGVVQAAIVCTTAQNCTKTAPGHPPPESGID
jgi:hypothetical protein